MSATAILKLQSAGFSAEQVTALAELIDTQATSKADLLEVEHRLDEKITDTKIDMIKWMIGLTFAQVGLILGVIKLFMH